MKKILFILFFSITSICAYSQANVLLSAGSTNAYYLASFQHPGFNAGATVEFPFAKNWGIQIGVNINSYTTSSNWSTVQTIGGQEYSFDEGRIRKLNFLEFPLSLSYKIKLSDNSYLRFNTGAYMGAFLGGTTILRSSNGYGDYALVNSYANTTHFAFLIGTGVEINKVYIGFEGGSSTTDGFAADGVLKTKIGYRF